MPADTPDMVLVPREPTEEMLTAGLCAYWPDSEFAEGPLTNGERARRCWSAMLSASPWGASGEGALRPASRSSVPTEGHGAAVLAASPLEIAYGCLWRIVIESSHLHEVRRQLGRCCGQNGKARGVAWAVANLPEVTEQEVREMSI